MAEGVRCTMYTNDGVMWQVIIHGLFILSAIGIAYTDRIMAYTAASGKATAAH